jgi:hypothetical protein
MFALYTRDGQGKRVSYEGSVLRIMDPTQEFEKDVRRVLFEKDVRRVLEVLYHWVCLFLVAELWNYY